jgi:sugar lactone lactonase YvrE
VRTGAAVVLSALGGLALFGCGGSSGSTGPSVTTGSLTVTITAPAGVTPSVTLTGPAGYHQSVSATATLTGLAVGSYTVTAEPATVSNPLVATVYDGAVTGASVAVSTGGTATASVSYAVRPGSGALWVVANGTATATVAGYSVSQLAASTTAAAATVVATGTATAVLFGAAFDASGNLWVTDEGDNAVVEFASSQLAASDTPTPAATLSTNGNSLNKPTGLTFDASGNLWVANYGNNTVVECAASQLAALQLVASAPATPSATLSATAGSLNLPAGLAFDAAGNLWVANASNSIVEYPASLLGITGSPAPTVTLTGGILSNPAGLAFDAGGNLWVANEGTNRVLEFTPTDLADGGTADPLGVVLAPDAAGSLNAPVGLAFDASGDLWVSNFGMNGTGDTVVEFAANQLVVTQAPPTPVVTVSGSSVSGPAALAFDPAPANLPLK